MSEDPPILGFDALLEDIPPYQTTMSGALATTLQSSGTSIFSTSTDSVTAVSRDSTAQTQRNASTTRTPVRTVEELIRLPNVSGTPLARDPVPVPAATSVAGTPALRTPRCRPVDTLQLALSQSLLSTSLLDEATVCVMPTAADQNDPLLQEEETRAGAKRTAEATDDTPSKRPCKTTSADDSSVQTEVSNVIADAISKGTEKICKVLEEQLKST